MFATFDSVAFCLQYLYCQRVIFQIKSIFSIVYSGGFLHRLLVVLLLWNTAGCSVLLLLRSYCSVWKVLVVHILSVSFCLEPSGSLVST